MGVILKAAVDEFFNRKFDDHLWVKDLSEDELWDAVGKLRPRPHLYSELRQHQLACFLLGVAYPAFAFWLDMGAGKTLLALELINYWFQTGDIKNRAMIFLKSDKAFYTWEKQIKLYGFDLPYTLLDGPSAQKWDQLQEFGDGLVFVPRPGARAMLTKDVVSKGRNKKTYWKIDDKLFDHFVTGVGGLVLDESTDDAHHQSLNFKIVEKMIPTVPIRYELAGRPVGRDPTLLWAQYYLLDQGWTLGETLALFRAAFFSEEENKYVPLNRRGYIKKHVFKKRLLPKLTTMVQHRSIAYTSAECGLHQEFTPIIEEVKFSEEAAAFYEKARSALIAAKKNQSEIKNIFIRMRQMSSGFIGFKDDETGERAQVEFGECPKFDRLMELLDEVPRDTKAVVFYEFTYSGKKIVEAAKAAGMNPIWLHGGIKDSAARQKKFETDDSCRLAVINHKVGAYSLDGLQDVASYDFFYESPVGAIDREQAERRLRRQGQKYRVNQYDLVTRGSADAKILAFHKEAEDLMKALLRDPSLLARE